MKSKQILSYLVMGLIIFTNTDCHKVEPPRPGTTIVPSPPPPPPPSIKNTAPKVDAGIDLILTLPTNEVDLNGACVDDENNISLIIWQKINGPASYNLNNTNILQPRLSNLVKGDYQFELTVFDSLGLYDMDTVNILVRNGPIASASSIIFEDRIWIFPWYPSIEVENFDSWIPAGSQYRVYIKRDGMPDWIEVSSVSPGSTSSYEYFIETRPGGAGMYNYGSLYIFYYGFDTNDTPDVKIEYW